MVQECLRTFVMLWHTITKLYLLIFTFLKGPPPPPPQIFNCGELRERHHGRLVEIEGKVNRSKGRFLELKDQHGCIQCVSPPGVRIDVHCNH